MFMTRAEKHQMKYFFIFIAPWFIGLIVFSIYPIIASLWYSFTDYDVVNPARFIGVKNYIDLANDSIFWISIKATLYYTMLSVPVSLILSLSFALLINQKVPFQKLFRTLMYLPSMVIGSRYFIGMDVAVQPPDRDGELYTVAVWTAWPAMAYR